MGVSKCPKCGKGIFQIESIMPIGYDREILSIICHTCNSIVGTVIDFVKSDEQTETNLQFQVLNKKLETVNNNIGQPMNGLKLLYNKLENLKKTEVLLMQHFKVVD